MQKPTLQQGVVTRLQLVLNMIMALLYFSWWFIPSHVGNIFLYSLLFFGETYHVLMSFLFWFTIWPRHTIQPSIKTGEKKSHFPKVAVFITVTGEPVSVVQETIRAVKHMTYPNFSLYVLNDGYVADKDNWREIVLLAKEEGVQSITRAISGGAKAGNINHALAKVSADLIAVFDADMQPYRNFLQKMVPYFSDPHVAFVQSPQYYENYPTNRITQGAWEQQAFFFGPIMRGKEKSNAAFICGTNFVIRKSALMEVGGLNETNIAEDFLTSQLIHQKKWKSYYVSEVLAHGLAPEDLLSYYKQQLRWARGSLEVLFTHNPLFSSGLSWPQRFEYLASALFYFNGIVAFIDMVMPLIYLYFAIEPVASTTTFFALFFIPFMILNLYTLYIVSNGSLTFRAISFTQSSWMLQLQALLSVLRGQKMGFAVTSKRRVTGNFLPLVYPHIAYILLVIVGAVIGISRQGFNPSIITNIAWAIFNCIMFVPFIRSSFQWNNVLTKKQMFSKTPSAYVPRIEIPKLQYE